MRASDPLRDPASGGTAGTVAALAERNGHDRKDNGFFPKRWLGALSVIQVVVNMAVLTFVIVAVLNATQRIGEVQQAQIELVATQNQAQLCAQHDMTIAIRQIGKKLGLPVEDIYVPSVKGFDCP